MSRFQGRTPIAYLIYGFVLFCLLVMIFFPYKRVAQTWLSELEEQTGIDLAYRSLSYRFPAGVRFNDVEVFLPQRVGRISAFKGETLTVKISLLRLLLKDLGVRFQGKAYGGELAGRLLTGFPVEPGPGSYRLKVEEVKYEEIVAPLYLRNFKISGRLTGEVDLDLEAPHYLGSGNGSLQAVLRQGRIGNLFIEGMDLPDFDFQEIRVEARLEQGKLRLESFTIESEILLGEIRGEIELHSRDLRESRLGLDARFKPAENDPVNLHGVAAFFNKTLDEEGYNPFRLQGSFRYPELL
jgi:type II secretion system protein N